MSSGHDLICRETFPEASIRNLGGRRTGLITGNRVLERRDLENLPVEVPGEIVEQLEHVSQLGLKNHYLGKPADNHTRWEHSKGAYTVGQLWLHVLYEDNRLPDRLRRKPYLSREGVKALTGYALLLHDWGHLHFSHLLEEALHEINWIPSDGPHTALEHTVLFDRLTGSGKPSEALKKTIQRHCSGGQLFGDSEAVIRQILNLITGRHGTSWLQAIVNGPCDADKIDYLRRDQHKLQSLGYPVGTRIVFQRGTSGGRMGDSDSPLPWLHEFLCDQYVNHAGELCIRGRSAVAMADLWRERQFLYDRFYLHPAIRAADRVVLEVIQQFAIRAVMSPQFSEYIAGHEVLGYLSAESSTPTDLYSNTAMDTVASRSHPIDLVREKYTAIAGYFRHLSTHQGRSGDRDKTIFEEMARALIDVPSVSSDYRRLIEAATRRVLQLDGYESLYEFSDDYILERPIEYPRAAGSTVRELVRSFHHQYFDSVLFDVTQMPRVLSSPRQGVLPRSGRDEMNEYRGLMVPAGAPSAWHAKSDRLVPLTEGQVRDLDRPIGRVLALCPPELAHRGQYVYHRLVAELDAAGVPLRFSDLAEWST